MGEHADRCPFATARTADPSRRLNVSVAWQPVSNVGPFLSRCRRSNLAAFGGSTSAAAALVSAAVSLASCSPDVRAPGQTREGALTAPSRDWPSHWSLTRRPELARPFRSVSRSGSAPTERPLHSIPGTVQSRDRPRHRCARTALRPVRLARRPRFADRLMTRQVLPKHTPHNARTDGRLRGMAQASRAPATLLVPARLGLHAEHCTSTRRLPPGICLTPSVCSLLHSTPLRGSQ